MDACLICQRIEDIKKNRNLNFVKELETSYVVIGDYQYYKGYTLVLSKIHAGELHELPTETRTKFLNEMAIIAEAVYKAFRPHKLNYELLGNTDRHLHWHLIPRYSDDPNPNSPIWVVDKNIRYAQSTKPSQEELSSLKDKLTSAIDSLFNIKPPANKPF